MFGQVRHCARVELRGCGQRAGVVAITEGAGREYVGYEVGSGCSTEALGASLHLRRVAGCYSILQILASTAISLRKFTIRITLYVRRFGCCLGKRP